MTELALIHGLAASREIWRHVISRSALDEFRECRPEARVEIVAGAGHIPMIERPRAFADALLRVVHRT